MPAPCPGCACPLSSSIFHSLFHCTTRTALFVHPCAWSSSHTELLHVSLEDSPLPDLVSSSSGVLPPDSLDHILTAQEFGEPAYADFICLLSCAVDSMDIPSKPLYALENDHLPLRFGSISTSVTPAAYVERVSRTLSIPFIAFTHPEEQLAHCSQHQRRQYLPQSSPLNPYYVAILLAMAQVQNQHLPRQHVYRVYLLTPNEACTQLHLYRSVVTGAYLRCLRDLSLPLAESLLVVRSTVPVVGNGRQILDVLRVAMEGAPEMEGRSEDKGTKRIS